MSLALLFADGFDNCDFITTTLKYPAASIPFYQGTIATGYRSTGAISIDNTAGTTITLPHVFGTQSRILWNSHIQINATSFTQQIFLILGASGAPLLQMQINADGTLSLLDGSGATLGSTTVPQALALNTWYWLEVNAVYGTSGSYEVWLGLAGAVPTKVLFGTANLTSTLPDRLTIEWSSPSAYRLRLDNMTVWSAAALSDRNGPSCVTGEIVGTLVNQGGWTKGAGTSVLQAVADRQAAGYAHVPDGTASYDETGAGFLSFNPAASSCFGLVLAVAVNLVAKPVDPTPTISGAVRQRLTTAVLGTQTVVDSTNTLVPGTPTLFGFATYQFYSQLTETSEHWNDLQILTSQWGAEASGDLQLTQVYLEKVTDLTGRKFGCGESSYSFTE